MSCINDRSPLSRGDLERLYEFFSSDRVAKDSMFLDEIDGMFAAIACTPDVIEPSEWMPLVWGSEEPEFDSLEEAEDIVGAIMRLFHNAARTIGNNEGYFPMLSGPGAGDIDGDLNPEWWASGFIEGMKLRGFLWFESDDAALATLVSSVFVMAKVDPPELDIGTEFSIGGEPAHVAISRLVYTIRDYWRGVWPAGGPGKESRVRWGGPNEPCRCGSGKKHKDCCGRALPTVH